MDEHYAIWILPETKSRKDFRDIIVNISNKLRLPSFKPHCTIYSNIKLESEGLKDLVTFIADRHDIFTVNVNKIKSEKDQWKRFFIDFKKSKQLDSIYNMTKQYLVNNRRFAYKPHLSLAYGEIGDKILYKTTKNLTIPTKLSFSSLALVKITNRIQNWDVVFERHLGDKNIL